MRCPDHPRELVNKRCPMCQGELQTTPELGEGAALLTPDPAALAKKRDCPGCGAPMTHLRIGQTQAWVEHCDTDDLNWVEKSDLRTIDMLLKSQARQKAFASMSESERKELAGGLAEATHQDTGPDVGIAGTVLVSAGIPLVDRTQGDRTPFLTWVYALALCGVYVGLKVDGLAYRAGSGDVLAAFTADFAHFGVGDLAANVLFLFVFGSAAEQKLPRWAFLGSLFLLIPLTTLAQGASVPPGTAVGGADGVIAGLIGMCLFLQPNARVLLAMPKFRRGGSGGGALFGGEGPVKRPAIRVPLWLYGVGWAAFHAVLFALGAPAEATLAVTGFVMGLALGFGLSRLRPG